MAADAAPTAPERRTFAEVLRRARLRAGLTQEQLADKAGLSTRGLSDLERGARSYPRPDTLRMLADGLGLTGPERAAFLRAGRRPAAPRLHTASSSSLAHPSPPVPLPVFLDALIGREDEIAHLVTMLRDPETRLVTLTGPGGVGKTRLAVAIAAEVQSNFPDGVNFIDLAPLRDPHSVLSAIASALGLPETLGYPLSEVIHRYLAGRHHLLVVDNFEHLLEAAPVVSKLLAAGPRVTVLVTSREPLRLRGEREFPVPPFRLPAAKETSDPALLAVNEAVAFFVDRARAVRPDFLLSVDNAPAVAEICHRLDGLPLALELAAARIKLLPPATLLARLDARLPLLIGGTRDAPQRQRTLRDMIAWSHDLLSVEERALFRRLAVFAGGCTIDAADAVVDPDATLDVLAGIASLVDKSLLRQEDRSAQEPRFGHLETIREFGLEQLSASGEEPAMRDRHAAWVLALVERAEPELFRSAQRTWWERLEAERPNIRAALAWLEQTGDAERAQRLAGSTTQFCIYRGNLREGQDWMRRALAIPGETSPAARAVALIGAGTLTWFRNDNDAAQALLEQGLAIAGDGDFAYGVAVSQFMLGMIAWARGDFKQALVLGEKAISGLREAGHPGWLAIALGDMGTIARLTGDDARGAAWAAEGLALNRALGNRWVIANYFNELGIHAQQRSDLVDAAWHYVESTRLFREIGDNWYIASPLSGLASIAVGQGYPEVAAQLLGVVAVLREVSGSGAWPNEQDRDEQTAATAQAALGEARYACTVEAGRRLPLEQAVDEAMAVVADVAARPR